MGMMETILTLIILGMLLQGVVPVVDSLLETVKVKEMIDGVPLVGQHLNLIWAYLLVLITQINDGGGAFNFGASAELLSLGRFGTDVATAIAILAFIPVRDAALEALRKGIGGSRD